MIRFIIPAWLIVLLYAFAQATFLATALAQEPVVSSPFDDPVQREVIRFLTTDDFPPFNSRDEEKTLNGFNIDLARAICADLSMSCDIKAIPWDDLLPELRANNADVVIAAHRLTFELAREFNFSRRYFYTPARFAVRRTAPDFATTPTGLDGRRVGVTRGSAYEAYLIAFFHNTTIVQFDSPELVRQALMSGRIDAIFDDGIGLVFWVNGTASRTCCVLRGGPYFEPLYFGDGIAMVLRRDDRQMRRLINQSIGRLQANGRMREIVEKFFPIRVY